MIFLTITITITLITDKTLTGEERKKIFIYYIQTMTKTPATFHTVF